MKLQALPSDPHVTRKSLFCGGLALCLLSAVLPSAADTPVLSVDFDSLTPGAVDAAALSAATFGGTWALNETRGQTVTIETDAALTDDQALLCDDPSGNNGLIDFFTVTLDTPVSLAEGETTVSFRTATRRSGSRKRLLYRLLDPDSNVIADVLWYDSNQLDLNGSQVGTSAFDVVNPWNSTSALIRSVSLTLTDSSVTLDFAPNIIGATASHSSSTLAAIKVFSAHTASGPRGVWMGDLTVTTSGLAASSPWLSVAASVSFSNNGPAATYTIPLTNLASDGTTPLNISSVTATGAAAGDVSNISFPASVPAVTGTDIAFDFTPSAGSGNYEFDLEIASDDEFAASPRTVAVQITVQPSPVLVVDPSFFFFNDGATANYGIPISNAGADGTTALTIGTVSAARFDSQTVTNLQAPASVASGQADVITFDFTPDDGAGFYTFDLEIPSNDDSAASPRIVQVDISVLDPAISVDTAPIDFGSLSPNPAPQTTILTITNAGGTQDLLINEVLTVVTGSSAFSVTSFPGPIAPGGSGNLEITFNPGSWLGPFRGTLTIVSNDSAGVSPQVRLAAFIDPPVPPPGHFVAADFGTANSPVAEDYEQFIVSEGASQVMAGVTATLTSRDANVTSNTASGDALLIDFARTSSGYISITLEGLVTGNLQIYTTHNVNSASDRPVHVYFNETGEPLFQIGTSIIRRASNYYALNVEAGKTYELRVVQNNSMTLSYISSMLLWGDAIPGGSGVTGYDAFVTTAGLDPATTGQPQLDPDFDGVPTGIEWVVGGSPNDPASPDTGKLPSGVRVTADPDGDLSEDDYLLFRYRRSAAAHADPDTAIAVEYGSDLDGWTVADDGVDGVVFVETPDGIGPGIDEVLVYLPVNLAIDGSLFARLAVTIGTPPAL